MNTDRHGFFLVNLIVNDKFHDFGTLANARVSAFENKRNNL